MIVGILELLLALCFGFTHTAWQSPPTTNAQSPREHSMPLTETLRLPIAWLSILLFVAFSGAQASAGQ